VVIVKPSSTSCPGDEFDSHRRIYDTPEPQLLPAGHALSRRDGNPVLEPPKVIIGIPIGM
jgi:hypothetical protein